MYDKIGVIKIQGLWPYHGETAVPAHSPKLNNVELAQYIMGDI